MTPKAVGTFDLNLIKVFLAITTAYALVFIRIRGRNVIFLGILVALMVPPEAAMLPNYITVATLGAVSSYVDSGLAPDRRYAWAVQATNSGSASAWHYFGDRYTAPATPTERPSAN